LVYILGADHGGYIKRIKATVEALSNGKVTSDVKICQLVNFMSSGVPVKMSKRSGTFTTVRDVINEVEQGIIRFIMLTRKNDATLDFDLEKVKEQSKDNPVFYTQYACVRALSIINNSEDICPLGYEKFKLGKYDLSLLSSHEEMELIKLLVSWPKVIEASARQFEPHRIAFYAINLASSFHSLWNLGKENNNYRFVIVNDIDLTAARLALVSVVREIICQAFDIIGVKPLDKM
jgi:arginyl-tRNA synthetase